MACDCCGRRRSFWFQWRWPSAPLWTDRCGTAWRRIVVPCAKRLSARLGAIVLGSVMKNCRISWKLAFVTTVFGAMTTGCVSFGPSALSQTRLHYNEVVKTTAEEQLLLNIVRLRYNDTPSSLAISTIAAQFERSQSFAISPFFTAAGGDINRSFTAVLPQAQVLGADRPTFSLTPQDDQEFTRKLFTPVPLEGVIYLAKTTWPVSTIFRLYLENLNWVSNAQTASGPAPTKPPEVNDFMRGIEAMQVLQDRGQIVFGIEERSETLGGPLPTASVAARDVIEAAKSGYVYRPDEKGGNWTLIKKSQQPVLLVDPAALASPAMQEFTRTFRLKQGLLKYDITQEALHPFPSTFPAEGVTNLDLETRSLLQALYFVSHGIDIPQEHVLRGLVQVIRDNAGSLYDSRIITHGLFQVRSAGGTERPPGAFVAIQYQGYWFYIEWTDQRSKATFSLLMELARLELTGKSGPGPLLTLPLSGR
ncbi:hypothetical protein APY03_2958 [Variovorax sp. WDL1]|nr:hypothetical protein APY03_2958 [Variovorax sp. WDL1]